MEIRAFFNLLYENGIDLKHLDAIHDIAKKHKVIFECRQFEEWYAENIGDELLD